MGYTYNGPKVNGQPVPGYNPNHGYMPSAPVAQEEDPFDAFLATLQGIKPYDASGDIGRAGQAQLDAILKQAGIANSQLGQQNAAGGAEIDRAYSDFGTNTGKNNADYGKQQAYINGLIGKQGQASQADAAAAGAGVIADLKGQGNSGNSAAAQVAATQQVAGAQNQLQADLSNRLAEVQGQAQNNTANSGALVNQGAKGTLANNYSMMLAKIQAERAAQEGDVNSKTISAQAEAKASAASQANDLATKIAQYKLEHSKESDPLKQAMDLESLRGAKLSNDKAEAEMGASKGVVDLAQLDGYSPIGRRLLGQSGGDVKDALQGLYAASSDPAIAKQLGLDGVLGPKELAYYVQELTSGAGKGTPWSPDGADTSSWTVGGDGRWSVPTAPPSSGPGGDHSDPLGGNNYLPSWLRQNNRFS